MAGDIVRIPVREIKEGDEFPGIGGWVARSDAQNLHDHYCSAEVQFRDGGVATREWDDPDYEIEVMRSAD